MKNVFEETINLAIRNARQEEDATWLKQLQEDPQGFLEKFMIQAESKPQSKPKPKTKPKPKSKPNKLKPKSPPKTNHPPPTPRGNTATSRRGVPNEYDLQARCRPSGLPCDVVLPSDVKNSYTAACAPSLDGDAFASAAAANGTSSLRPERVVIIYGITLIGEPVSTQ